MFFAYCHFGNKCSVLTFSRRKNIPPAKKSFAFMIFFQFAFVTCGVSRRHPLHSPTPENQWPGIRVTTVFRGRIHIRHRYSHQLQSPLLTVIRPEFWLLFLLHSACGKEKSSLCRFPKENGSQSSNLRSHVVPTKQVCSLGLSIKLH